MSQYALLIDYKYCTGCHVCEVSCRKEHDIPLEEWGIKLTELGPVKMQDKWLWDYLPVPSDLCDLCEARVAEGKKPACVHHCLASCMELVPVEELGKVMAEHGPKVTAFMPR